MVLANVKKAINNWDPINLLDHAPKDEYNVEINEISLSWGENIKQNGLTIYETFSKSFGMTFTKTIEECICIAKEIEEQY